MACCKGCAAATYLRGVAEGMDRGLEGLGELDVSTYNALSADYQNAIRGWKGRTFTAAQGVRVLDGTIAQVTALRNKVYADAASRSSSVGTLLFGTSGQIRPTTDQAAELDGMLRQLAYLRGVLASKGADGYVFASPHKTWQDVVNATTAPIGWQFRVASMTSYLADVDRKVFSDLWTATQNLPATIIATAVTPVTYTIQQIAKGVGDGIGVKVPTWVVPTVLGLIAAAVVAPYARPVLRRL